MACGRDECNLCSMASVITLPKSLRTSLRAVVQGQGQGVAQEGYKFLLRDAYSQLWVLLRRYIANAEQRSGAA